MRLNLWVPFQVFESFGTIELVQLPRDEAGLCKGFAFVQVSIYQNAACEVSPLPVHYTIPTCM